MRLRPISLSSAQLRVAAIIAAVAVTVVPAGLLAWGDAGHRITGEAAALRLPTEMPPFFRAASKQLAYLNPEPDRWKDKAESSIDHALDDWAYPDHFIDMDLVDTAVLNAALKAPHRYAYIDTITAHGAKAPIVGFLPFRILELSQRLRVEFRMWRAAPNNTTRKWIEARIINDAGILGHYVADGSNPLHATKQYNGWTGENPNGYATDRRTHGRFEGAYVQSNIKLADVLAKVDPQARVLPDFRSAIVSYLSRSASEVEHFYQVDKANAFDSSTTASENKAFASERLATGAQMLRDIWWTAWVTSVPAPRPSR